MDLTPWLVLVHVTGAAILVGGDIILNLAGFQAWRTGDAEKFLWSARVMSPGITVGALLTITAGISLVLISDAWSFTSGFVLFGLAAVIISGSTESTYFRRQVQSLQALVDTEPGSPQIRSVMGRITLVAAAANVLFVAVIWAMVFKPGA